MRLRIVIPTLDEAAGLAPALDSALAASGDVVVSDGGSDDGTVELARAGGARIVAGPRGRGPQLNAGAAVAGDHDVLLFLHADTVLPAGAASAIAAAIDAGAVGGAFRIRFVAAGASRLLALGSRLANARAAITGWPLGDHAQFVRRDAFEALGGFREWPLLEDLDFARRLRRHGRTTLLRATVETSARRFERLGVPRTVAINWLIFALYGLGVPPPRLAGLYYAGQGPAKKP
jgi:rSAM/selenodomain-associated transferase 2